MEPTRRPARPSDTEFARDVHHHAYRDVVERQFGPWVEEEQDRFVERGWAPAAFDIVLCDGVPCGYLCVEEREGDVHVREIALLPEFQGRGIGSSLLREVIERAPSPCSGEIGDVPREPSRHPLSPGRFSGDRTDGDAYPV